MILTPEELKLRSENAVDGIVRHDLSGDVNVMEHGRPERIRPSNDYYSMTCLTLAFTALDRDWSN